MSAPNRIWAGEDAAFTKRWRTDDRYGGTEYVRADVAKEALEEAKATLTDLDARLFDCGALHTAEDAYDTSYRGMVIDALVTINSVLSHGDRS